MVLALASTAPAAAQQNGNKLPVGPEHMPQIKLSQANFTLDEPAHSSCSDSHVGTEKTFGVDDDGNPVVTRNYGPVLTSEKYKVTLDRSPGAGKYVSVEVWEPTDLDRPDVRDGLRPDGTIDHTGRFSENARIHGISWRGGQQGRISIAKSHLTFTDRNWNQPQTVTVNIHCAQHDAATPLPIWHFAFRHDDRVINPGSDHQYRLSDSVHGHGTNRKGDNSSKNTSLRIAQVRVADRTTPAAITGNVDGKLVLDAHGSGFTTGGKKMIGVEFVWNHPDNSLGNDYDDASAQFAAFRVKLRTVEPAGHPVQEKIVRIDHVSGKPRTAVGWYAALEAKGHVGWVRGSESPDSKYEWNVVPLDLRWNEVEAERVTKCVLLTSRAGPNGGRASRIDETANPTCPAALQGEGAGAPAVSVPDTAVANLQLAAVDDASASVTWDAVAHATSYDVSWDANGSQTAVSGVESVTGTSATIRHDAQEAMTLTVTVTPEYVDGNGATQQLDALAATATLAVGPGGDALSADAQGADSQTPSCVSDALLADVDDRIANSGSPAGSERWTQVKNALTGQANAIALAEVRTIYDRRTQHGWSTSQWDPVIEAMECLAAPPQEQPEQAEVQPVTPATPELSLSAGSAVDEGGNATFTVTADPAPQSDLTIAWTVAQSGEYLDAPGAGSRTVTLTAGTTSTDLSVATVDDAADEADGSVSVTLGAGTGYTIATGKGSAAVAVRDNDEPVVSIAAGSGVTEGASASFTISASPAPAAPLDVTLTVGQSGDFAASGETGSRTVTVPVTGSATFEVATVDDGADEPDGSVTATLGTGTGYTVAAAPGNAATVAVSDNDAAASGPTISIADATLKENQRTGYFTVTLSEPVNWPVKFHYATRDSSPVSAKAGEDYLAWQRSWRLPARFRPGETETRIHVRLYDDSHDEDPETFEMVLFDVDVNGPPGVSVSIADGVAVGTITNDDPMPAAWLARFGRAVAEHALRDIADRIAAPRIAGVEGVLAGQALGGPTGAGSPAFAAPDGFNSRVDRRFDAGFGSSGPAGPGQVMSLRDFMLSSSFTATGAVDMTGGSMAFWGRASEGSFDGMEGRVSLSGDAMTALLGADYARGPWLLGMALAESEGKSSYADTGTSDAAAFAVPAGVPGGLDGLSVQAGSGEVEGRLTAVIPYLALEASEHVRLWSAMGQGSGAVTVTPALGGRYEAATSWTMMAAGLRGDLLAPGGHTGPALALTSDALWVRTSSEKTRDLAASESDVSRLRLGLEGSWAAALGGDASLTPKLELGARHDGGDGETGFGVEVGTGLAWVDPKLGLTFDLSARTLLTHDAEGREDRGVAAQLAFDPDGASARGLSLGLTQDWGGQAAGGLDALFSDAPLEDRTGSGSSMAESRWVAEAAYGLPVFGGRFTGSPHMGLGLATGARDYTLGWRLEPAAGGPSVSFGVQATRRESDGTVPEHTVGFEINARW